MVSKAEQKKSGQLEKVRALLDERLKPDEAAAATQFLELFCRNVSLEDLATYSADNLYGAVYSLWRFGEQRRSAQTKVRVYNPRAEEHGWKSTHTVIEIVNDDMPFLVDSVTGELATQEIGVHIAIHPIVHLRRDNAGNRTGIAEKGDEGERAESFMHIEINELTDPAALEALKHDIESVLGDVRVVVGDWKPMLGRLREAAKAVAEAPKGFDKAEVDEAKAFVEWLADNNFTLMGYREYDFATDGDDARISIVADSGLGVLRDPDMHVLRDVKGLSSSSPEVIQFLRKPEIMIVTKANVRSRVHRPIYMDYIGIKRFNEAGDVVGERRFVGLFTSVAYNQSPTRIPYLRRRVSRTLDRAGMEPSSHDGKALVNILENFPRDELFQVTEDEIFDTAMGILHLQERPRIRLYSRLDKFGRFASCLVFVPKDRYDTDLRMRFQEILAEYYNGWNSAFYVHLGDSALARLHFIIGTQPGEGLHPPTAEVELALIEGARSWNDNLRDALIERHGEEAGLKLFHRYADAFPHGYRDAFTGLVAVHDIDQIETLEDETSIAMNLYRPIEESDHMVRFKLAHAGGMIALSDCLPMLERSGFRVRSENPYTLRLDGGAREVWIHDFSMVDLDEEPIDLGAVKEDFQNLFERLWRGEIENDGFNQLVVKAGLDWREVVLLRALARYLRQVGIPYSQAYMEETLVKHADVCHRFVALFEAKFDPAFEGDRAARVAEIRDEILASLDGVDVLDEDRMLRRFLNLMDAALRTSFYQRDADGGLKPTIGIKFRSTDVAELPLPHPYAEIFVYSSRVEGVHLRGGQVARGGLRWSDRREDFRTEVLGLMKAQMVKNAVIVPVGAKGGFVPKKLPAGGDRDAVQQEGIACYKAFVNALLDVTDNRVGADVVVPDAVVRYDDDDPYLVVAADKGTATFSDIANGIALERGFWLGDAFASGGSSGYDHKGMAITARGAWESVKRHFRELGTDIQNEDFSVVGIGDMSGDVFGNGMLLSQHIKLVAAFDHRNIIIDPNPDPAVSFAERKRLFELPRSSWADYDIQLLSKGGACFDRRVKSITVSPEAKAALGLKETSYAPLDLIRALLLAPVDLLWIGGIGTYVKAHAESHADVGDRANDAVRVDGRELRCKVVGEGGNLGFTQLGRIEFARQGGRLNTDAVDNSAGVDCSDHEVNIKILLGTVVEEGEMTGKQRDRLLEEMTDEVADLVLRDNYLQSQAITIEQQQGNAGLEPHIRFMQSLERQNRLNPAVEYLPDVETREQLIAGKSALTRPEIAVLLAYAKMTIYEDLITGEKPDDERLSDDLVRYFPTPLQKKYRDAIQSHRLRDEIVATHVANSIVNRAGITFVHDVMNESGAALTEVVRAYAIARAVFDVRRYWAGIEALDNKVSAQIQGEMLQATRELIVRGTEWFLRNGTKPLDIVETTNTFRPGVAAIEASLSQFVGSVDAGEIKRARAAMVKRGVPAELADQIASIDALGAATDIVLSSMLCERPIEEVAKAYFAVGSRLGLDWLRSRAERISADNHWDRMAISMIVEDLYGQQRALTNVVLRNADGAGSEQAMAAWSKDNAKAVSRSNELIKEFRSSDALDIPRLAILNRQIRAMISG